MFQTSLTVLCQENEPMETFAFCLAGNNPSGTAMAEKYLIQRKEKKHQSSVNFVEKILVMHFCISSKFSQCGTTVNDCAAISQAFFIFDKKRVPCTPDCSFFINTPETLIMPFPFNWAACWMCSFVAVVETKQFQNVDRIAHNQKTTPRSQWAAGMNANIGAGPWIESRFSIPSPFLITILNPNLK